MKKQLKYIFPILSVSILLAVCCLSHQPGDISGQESAYIAALLGISNEALRSACHYLLFFLITVCCGISLVLWDKPLWWLFLILVLCWLDEATKPMIDGRHFSWIDTGKNMIGTLMGMLLTFLIHKVKKKCKT